MKLNPQIKQELKEYVVRRMHDKSAHVEVISSYKLSDNELSTLRTNISVLEKADITNSVDPSILAGVIIKFGSKMIDLSIKGELQKVKQRVINA